VFANIGVRNNSTKAQIRGKSTQIDAATIEDRFKKTLTGPLVWYDKQRALDSPYRGGEKNLRYSSPNYISNVLFYDQTSNLSISKNEMYQTTSQSYHTSPQHQSDQRPCKTIDMRNNTGCYSPSKHMMDKQHTYYQSSRKSTSPITNRSSIQDANSLANSIKNLGHESVTHVTQKKLNISTLGKPPKYESPAKVLQNKIDKNTNDQTNLEYNSSISHNDLISVTTNSKVSNNQKTQLSEFSNNRSVHSYRSYKSSHLYSCKRTQNPKICNFLSFIV
jgi:hypothetical protein